MKRRIIGYTRSLLVLFFICSGSGCKDILDLEPHNSTFTGAYFRNGNDANSSIAGAYALLRSILLSNYSWHVYGDAPSGEFNINSDRDNTNYNISRGEFTGLNVWSSYWNWQSYYELLQQINLIINKVPDIPLEKFSNKDDKNKVIGEAYFLRAFTYFYMSRIWGDVPLKLEPDLDISQAKNVGRTPVVQVLEQCLKDVKVAEYHLYTGYDDANQRAVRANKESAFALEAHIRAWIGDYSGCEKAADQVIKAKPNDLVDSANYAKVFVGKSTEGIFEININYSQNEGIALNGGGYLPTLKAPFIAKKTVLEWPVQTAYINAIYTDTTDLRYKTFFFQPLTSEGQVIKFSNITYADGSPNNDPRLSNNMIIFRLADIMLLRAEALNNLGRDTEARDLLNVIRKRAGIKAYDGTGQELAGTILRERLRELFFEGHAYYDMIRTGTLLSFNEDFNEDQLAGGGWLWPIDPAMFKDDFTLVQTPYWQGKL